MRFELQTPNCQSRNLFFADKERTGAKCVARQDKVECLCWLGFNLASRGRHYFEEAVHHADGIELLKFGKDIVRYHLNQPSH